MAKVYHEFTLNSAATLGTTLHTKLLEAGWTILFADADAIGTGSSSSPAWDKAFAATTYAGTAIYRSPGTIPLYLRIALYWQSANTQVFLHMAAGTGWTSGSTLDGTTGLRGGQVAAVTNTATVHLAIDSDYFAYDVNGSTGFHCGGLGHPLNLEGNTTAQTVLWQRNNACTGVTGWPTVTLSRAGGAMVLHAGAWGEQYITYLVTGSTGAQTGLSVPSSLKAPGNLAEYPLGYYFLTSVGLVVPQGVIVVPSENADLSNLTMFANGANENRYVRTSANWTSARHAWRN